MALKGVVATVVDQETKESITVHVDRLVLNNPRLRGELVLEPFVPFMFLFVLFRILLCLTFWANAPWTNLISLRLRQYMNLPLRPAR